MGNGTEKLKQYIKTIIKNITCIPLIQQVTGIIKPLKQKKSNGN